MVDRRDPLRPLTYTALRAVLNRINDRIGTDITLHDLRHTLCLRLIEDPNISLVDVQQVMRHRWITTTSGYLRPRADEVIARVHEHYTRPEPVPQPLDGWTYDPPGSCRSVRDRLMAPARTTRPHSGQRPAIPTSSVRAAASSPTPTVPTGREQATRGELLGLVPLMFNPDASYQQRWRLERGMNYMLDWLETFPGEDWQDRWLLSGSDQLGKRWGPKGLSQNVRSTMTLGLRMLIVFGAIRPSYPGCSAADPSASTTDYRAHNQAETFAAIESRVLPRDCDRNTSTRR